MTEVALPITQISRDVVDNNTKISTRMESNRLYDNLEMFREADRLRTFESWPHSFITPEDLAKVGFYHKPSSYDLVVCHFCKIEISRFEEGDVALAEHVRWSPNCPLLRRRQTENVPLDRDELNRLLPPVSYDVCGSNNSTGILHPDAQAEESSSEVELEEAPRRHQPIPLIKHPDYPMYALEVNRMRTFDDWPRTMKQRPRELTDAGFFYTGKSDRVLCHSCGGGLRDWDDSDDPWEQHALWFSKCDYLKLVKGEDYIKYVQEKFQPSGEVNGNSDETMPEGSDENVNANEQAKMRASEMVARPSTSTADLREPSSERPVNESKLCKICYTNEYNTAFYPCGHVVACAKCASSVTTCPVCRKPFDNLIRIYLS